MIVVVLFVVVVVIVVVVVAEDGERDGGALIAGVVDAPRHVRTGAHPIRRRRRALQGRRRGRGRGDSVDERREGREERGQSRGERVLRVRRHGEVQGRGHLLHPAPHVVQHEPLVARRVAHQLGQPIVAPQIRVRVDDVEQRRELGLAAAIRDQGVAWRAVAWIGLDWIGLDWIGFVHLDWLIKWNKTDEVLVRPAQAVYE